MPLEAGTWDRCRCWIPYSSSLSAPPSSSSPSVSCSRGVKLGSGGALPLPLLALASPGLGAPSFRTGTVKPHAMIDACCVAGCGLGCGF